MLRIVKHQLNHSKVALCEGLRGIVWLGCCSGVGFGGVVGAVVDGMGGHGLWLLSLRGVRWLGCRCNEGHGWV